MPATVVNNPSTAAAPAAKSIGAGFVVKTTLCVIAFLAAAALFAFACGEVLVDYTMLFAPSKEQTLPWLIRTGASALLFLLTFSVTVVLVRPAMLAAATIVGGMAVYALVLGGGLAAWCGAGAGAVMLVTLLYSVVKQIENQIDFSLRPLGDKELVLSSVLAVLIAVPAGLGYAVDAERGHYVIPPRITAYVQQESEAYVGKIVGTELVPAPLRDAAMDSAKEEVATMVKGLEKTAEPYGQYVPYILGALAYFSFQVVMFIPGFAAVLLLAPIFFFLKLFGFAHVSKQTRVVTRLTLAKEAGEPAEPMGKPASDPWAGSTRAPQ